MIETVIGDRFIAICLLSNEIMDYHIVSQGKTVIPGLDDGEEMMLTDVSPEYDYWFSLHLSFYLIYFISSALLLASLKTETELSKCMCMSDLWLGVYRNDDAKRPNVGLSHHKSGEDTDTWSQRCRRVRSDGCKSRTCARSVRLWFRYPWIGPFAPKFLTYTLHARSLQKFKGGIFAQVFVFTSYSGTSTITRTNYFVTGANMTRTVRTLIRQHFPGSLKLQACFL